MLSGAAMIVILTAKWKRPSGLPQGRSAPDGCGLGVEIPTHRAPRTALDTAQSGGVGVEFLESELGATLLLVRESWSGGSAQYQSEQIGSPDGAGNDLDIASFFSGLDVLAVRVELSAAHAVEGRGCADRV